MKKKIVIVILSAIMLTICADRSYAQTEPMYSQYMFNMLNLNPAYAGSRGVPTVTTLFRKQWVNIPGAPQTTTISFDMPVNNRKVGVGLQIVDDKIGLEHTTGVMASYAFRIPVSETGVLSLGLKAGLLNYRANFTEAITFMPNDPTFYNNVNGFLPAAGAGIYYTTDRFYVGLSAPSILETRLNSKQIADTRSGSLRTMHLFATAGTVVDLSDDVKLKPSLLMKSISGAPLQFDINTNVWFHDKIAIGASYRTSDAVVGMVEWQMTDQIRFGYGYDYTTSKLNAFNQSTHELMFRFELGSNKSSFVSPRYF